MLHTVIAVVASLWFFATTVGGCRPPSDAKPPDDPTGLGPIAPEALPEHAMPETAEPDHPQAPTPVPAAPTTSEPKETLEETDEPTPGGPVGFDLGHGGASPGTLARAGVHGGASRGTLGIQSVVPSPGPTATSAATTTTVATTATTGSGIEVSW